MSNKIFGYSWEEIQRAQLGGKLSKPLPPLVPGKDIGFDPQPDGKFKMVPSGDIVDLEERKRRIGR